MNIERLPVLFRRLAAALADLVAKSHRTSGGTPCGAVVGFVATVPEVPSFAADSPALPLVAAGHRAEASARSMARLDAEGRLADFTHQWNVFGLIGRRPSSRTTFERVGITDVVLASPEAGALQRAKPALGSFSRNLPAALFAGEKRREPLNSVGAKILEVHLIGATSGAVNAARMGGNALALCATNGTYHDYTHAPIVAQGRYQNAHVSE